MQKSPQVVKHVSEEKARLLPNLRSKLRNTSQKVAWQGEKRYKKSIEKRSVSNAFFGLSDKLTNLVLRRLFWQFLTVQESAKRANAMAFAKFRVVKFK